MPAVGVASGRILRWGLLGTARINRSLVPPLRASLRNQVVAVASRSFERAARYAAERGIPRAYGDYDTLLADPEIDVVYIPLPNSLHVEWTLRAVAAGKHVLCEKPLALSPTEVDQIAAAAQTAGVVVTEAFMYRHHPQTLQVKELIATGAIGRVRLIRGAFSFTLDRPADVRWRPELGGGCLLDIGCYPVNFARWIVGREPVEVYGYQKLAASGVDETFMGQLRFPGEVYAQFDCSFRAPFRMTLEIVGESGALSLPCPFKPGGRENILLNYGNEQRILDIAGQDTYAGEIEDLADAILLSRPPRISLADSRGNAATLDALRQSATAGRPVTLSAST